jgi:large subunit ribosomal protein L24
VLIRVNDEVIVLAGRDAGQKGKVLKVDREKNRIVVEGLNRVYKHVKKSQRNPQGGRLSKEVGIDASNVAIVDPQTGKPTRIGVRFLADGTKERYSKKSGVSLGMISPPRAARAAKV